jgi:hypothetical protein
MGGLVCSALRLHEKRLLTIDVPKARRAPASMVPIEDVVRMRRRHRQPMIVSPCVQRG